VNSPDPLLSRRSFIHNSARAVAAVGATSLVPHLAAQTAPANAAPAKKIRMGQVGTGGRGTFMWAVPLNRDYPDKLEFVGMCDINPKRAAYSASLVGPNIPTFTDFDKMVSETRPDKVIVTTVDGFHSQYVTRAMELGCDVLCEKPLCTKAEHAQDIIDACKKTGRHLDVTFNMRYQTSGTKVKELLMAGAIGDLYSVDYAEFLDLDHGADYYRRWHAFKENSGTLLCHKSSHHFDQLNWWIRGDPVEVTALGRLNKYGHNGPFRHANCRVCTYKDKCEFYWDINKVPALKKLYVDCESEDGYFRDACVYRSAIDIYDAMSVQIKYSNHVIVTYSLNSTEPYEGQRIVFNGSKGRIEVRNYDSQPWKVENAAEVQLTRNFKGTEIFPIKNDSTEHGGADRRIRDSLFRPPPSDPLEQRAGMRAGIMSAIIGVAAYTSIETGEKVKIQDLIKL
jgi:predicted dehydrogenase